MTEGGRCSAATEGQRGRRVDGAEQETCCHLGGIREARGRDGGVARRRVGGIHGPRYDATEYRIRPGLIEVTHQKEEGAAWGSYVVFFVTPALSAAPRARRRSRPRGAAPRKLSDGRLGFDVTSYPIWGTRLSDACPSTSLRRGRCRAASGRCSKKSCHATCIEGRHTFHRSRLSDA